MASNLKYSTALKNAQQDAVSSVVGSAGLLKIYDGAQPASPDTAVTTQNLLATLTCASPFGAASSNGVVTAGSISSGTGSAAAGTGKTATWYRLCKSDGTPVIDGTVAQSGADMNLNNTSIAQGQTVQVTSYTLSNAN